MLGRIAIYLSDDSACERRISVGMALAKAHGADVVGIYPADEFPDTYGGVALQSLRKTLREQAEAHRVATKKSFEQAAEAAGIDAVWRAPHTSAETALPVHARYCDLLIMSKVLNESGATGLVPNLPESVIMAAGRPVLMLPNAGPIDSIGERILYCWDQRREAARAFTDAAPFLRNCQSLAILEVDRSEKHMDTLDLHAEDLTRYCTSLGYPEPQRIRRESGDIGVGHVILNTASENDIDLIVMGAYGHSRMRQWIMGGASRTLLASMTVPVLLAQ